MVYLHESYERVNAKMELSIIARMQSDFTTKFGLPRQSGLTPSLEGAIVFEPPYRDENALRGLLEYSHLWLLFGFSKVESNGWSPTVKPPKLGGNTRMGVFATRSPFRPNPIGLSVVKLLRIEKQAGKGSVLIVSGSDLMDTTPIYDIKPYLPYVDSHPEALNGFAGAFTDSTIEVVFPAELLTTVPEGKRAALIEALAHDPRPAYHDDPSMKYGFEYAGLDIRFSVQDGVLTVYETVNVGGSKVK